MNDIEVPEVIHENLRELEMNGYEGNRRQLELVKYLVDNAVNLDLLVVSPLRKAYKGSNNWIRVKSDEKLSSEEIKELRTIVPQAEIRTVLYA